MRNDARRRLLAAAAVCAAWAAAGQAAAQTSASATATASVTLGSVISITKNANLSFGAISVLDPATAATVSVGTSDNVASIANAAERTGGTVGSAAFTVSGAANATYAVTFPQASINLGAGAGAPSVDTFTTNLSSNAGQLSAGGIQSISVGGILHVPANTTPGSYTGTFQVGVAYN